MVVKKTELASIENSTDDSSQKGEQRNEVVVWRVILG